MKNLFLIVGIISIFISCKSASNPTTTTPSHSITWMNDISLKEALASATESNKPVFIDVSTSWCGYCKKMKKKVYTDHAVSDYLSKNYISVKIDAEKGEGIHIAKQFDIRAYPTQIIVDKNGRVQSKNVGYQDANELLKFIR
ncbi:MAG: hypothetical protein COA58_07150 [Bacteroidetes bacterium]|nr:MAG: hypothetical protein COA58_07150 [Bacteroidota bacterium]